ncbi:MAG TPA: xanthine dehydrogenase family protein molybdopterin-binding subunit, partial [Acidimicrobiia bacterium]|nr:xanthine dehydrogenase family protein molybdopterin-binding subunit [Acidimicrobiia bacterium]
MADAVAAVPGPTRVAGSRINRVEDGRLLTGRGTFVDDIKRPGMLHACFVRSPYARARVLGIDIAEALALTGVRAVFVASDLNPLAHGQWHSQLGPRSPETPRPPLADDEVRFAGDQVALVIANSRYVA